MPNNSEIYELVCSNLQVPPDNKVVKAIIEVSRTGELNLSSLSFTVQTCNVLSKTLPQIKDVVKLNLGDCLLPPQGLTVLLSTIHLTHVSSLQLRGNNIAGPGVYKLSKMLSRSANIKNLGLEWNSLGLCSEALTQFCSAVATNHSIETLDLRNNQLDEGCAAQLANMLRKNITLRVLDVRWNSIEQLGGQCLLSALQANKTLTSLRLQGNSIPNQLLTAIEQCCQHNLSLLQLESGYEARKELLASHVRTLATNRAHELQLMANKSQQQLSEMDSKVKELEALLVAKQHQLEEASREASEKTRELKIAHKEIEDIQQEIKLKENNMGSTIRDFRLQIDILNKALTANKSNVSELESSLAEERQLRENEERDRERLRERVRRLEMEVERSKEELQTNITDHIAAVEQERSQAQQRVALVEQDWSMRLQQRESEHCRAEQVYRERVQTLQTALESTNTQTEVERTKWAEERASIVANATAKESYKMMLLTEKVEHLKEEKASLDNQLSTAITTNQQLQRDNSSLMADLADLRRKLSAVQEELSSERLSIQKLRSGQTELQRTIEGLRVEIAANQRRETESATTLEGLRREIQRATNTLADKDRVIANIRKEEKDRTAILVTAIKTYVNQVNLSGQ
ncbi:leucine-rich repeat-containing protein 45-like [Macrosteles quadrilineatus]|uniref:leucine-rich repeat-containing protein 45-like n=1 Tax=Macrosteles quadrilineatus TaxID=74068 RepID=UPI0023E16037|nr:leucine-rich repeat-containing protein 45-like [Macrosteles quadrilineatus]